jgi:hypothetical protein
VPFVSRRELEVRDRERALLVATLTRRDDRVAELERQVDDLHRQGFAVSAPPNLPLAPPPEPLHPDLQAVLAGFSPDPEARAAWEAEFRSRTGAHESVESIMERVRSA